MLATSITTILLTGCEKAALLNPKGMIAADEMKLLITAVLLMSIVVVPVIIITILVAYKYRASNKNAKYDPDFHSVKLEIIWWILPIVIIAILGTVTWKSTHKLDPYKPLESAIKPLNIEVVSLNWRWLFIYPDQGIATMNFVEFPAHTPINFKITSDAPMNSFVIQQLAGQIYSMAGMTTKLSLIADEKGDYRGLSLAFSGDGFANMHFTARAVDQADFNQWVNVTRASKNALTADSYMELVKDSHDTSVMYFTLADQNLFDEIIMKYMGPDMSNMQKNQVGK